MNIKINNFMNNQPLNHSFPEEKFNNINNNNFACDNFNMNMNKEFKLLNEERKTTLIDTFNQVMENKTNIPQNNASINQDQKITMKFTFLNTIIIFVEGKLNEKFSEVFKRFKENQCPI